MFKVSLCRQENINYSRNLTAVFFFYIKRENCSGISKLPDGIGDDGLYVKDLTCRSKREHAVKFHLGCVQLCLN